MKKKIALVVSIIVALIVILFIWRFITLNNIKKLNEESIKISNLYYIEDDGSSVYESWKKDNIIKETIKSKSNDYSLTFWKDYNTDEGYTIFNNTKSYCNGAEALIVEPQANNIYLLDYNIQLF